MYIFKPLLFVILSIHRKEPPSAEINSDETSVLCGPGGFKSGEDQEVKFVSYIVFAYGFITLPILDTLDILFRVFLKYHPSIFDNY